MFIALHQPASHGASSHHNAPCCSRSTAIIYEILAQRFALCSMNIFLASLFQQLVAFCSLSGEPFSLSPSSKHGTPHCSFWKSRPQIAFWLVAPSTCLPQVCSLSKCIVLSASPKHQTSHFNHTAWPDIISPRSFADPRPDSSQSLATFHALGHEATVVGRHNISHTLLRITPCATQHSFGWLDKDPFPSASQNT